MAQDALDLPVVLPLETDEGLPLVDDDHHDEDYGNRLMQSHLGSGSQGSLSNYES